ncbi:MAG TPA: isopentenyl phosphate kinase [Thermoanaerobaculia bacterium]|nr:isopentenyl phosphate kinase [Thermoanaerobaculia bacterium]
MSLWVVKLGGSLITDKERPSTVRREVLARLARELAAARPGLAGPLLVSHGSGSFGHAAAARHGLRGGAREAARLPGVAATQDQAHRLHRIVIESLLEAGLAPFSLAPSSFLVAEGGEPVEVHLEPLLRALALGLVPVVFGDVVLDRLEGAVVCSTETVLLALAPRLASAGVPVSNVLWMGATRGVLDAAGRTVSAITADNVAEVLAAAAGAAGTDVTGGMRHRVETAWRLARSGTSSLILDGLEEGALERALGGEESGGTRVEARR